MKSKNKLIVFIILLVVFVLGAVWYFFTRQDKNTSFTILEKQWLENNKSQVIDISILKDIPVISHNGNGILFDFLTDLEEVTGLDFNEIAYQFGDDIKTEYSFQVVEQKNDNDILIYSDSYTLLTRNNVKYNKLSEIDGLTIGVLESDLAKVQMAFEGSNVIINSYATMDELLNNIRGIDSDNNGEIDVIIDGFVVPKMINFDFIISNTDLNISYNINEIRQDYVIRLGNNEKLNEIISKYYNKWQSDSYDESFGVHFSNSYFSFSGIGDKEKAEFRSKRYVYGFVDDKPYDAFVNNGLYGINKSFLDDFSNISDIDIDYKNYDNFESLRNAFNDGEVDLFFNNMSLSDYDLDNVNLVSNYDEQVVVLALPNNKVTVSSVKSLSGYDVNTIENTKIASYLSLHGVNIKTFGDIDKLLSSINEDSVVVLDSEVYNYYNSNKFKKYKMIYSFDLEDEYSFKVSNDSSNSIFIKYFNFYLSFISNQEIANAGYSDLVDLTDEVNIKLFVIIGIFVIVFILLLILILQKKGSKSSVVVSKDNKVKYIDVLTSLKNRNYLNDNIDAWDESLVYPQGIVIVDLNNIAYINDNYGHAEGDKIIKEAANILIKTQISNTEIMRTNGNEFLIYMVGYDEKQIVSYIRKLNKEFKDLSHNFGAAIGYSMITDEIKTVDDAINEATLDMRNNKEENR